MRNQHSMRSLRAFNGILFRGRTAGKSNADKVEIDRQRRGETPLANGAAFEVNSDNFQIHLWDNPVTVAHLHIEYFCLCTKHTSYAVAALLRYFILYYYYLYKQTQHM